MFIELAAPHAVADQDKSVKTPKRIQPLVEDGLVDEVLRPLMSGKEAIVYLVRCGEEIRCAKVYKDIAVRSFKKAVQYQEGRKVRNEYRKYKRYIQSKRFIYLLENTPF